MLVASRKTITERRPQWSTGKIGRCTSYAILSMSFAWTDLGRWIVQVCYSFWVLSSLSILNKLSWIDSGKLTSFILSAQVSSCYTPRVILLLTRLHYKETENGGIADRPGDVPDVFHTLFGVAGLFVSFLLLICLQHNFMQVCLSSDTHGWLTSTLCIVCLPD